MQCFQKDPNLRVSARKLLKHPWIVNARRCDSVVPTKSTEYEEAVKSVQEWNEALRSPNASISRKAHQPGFSSPISGHKDSLQSLAVPPRESLSSLNVNTAKRLRSHEHSNEDNWDDDFASAISPSALQLPHLKPQDNFAGMLSPEKLKAFASFEGASDSGRGDGPMDHDFELKDVSGVGEVDPLQTIRPLSRKQPEEECYPARAPRRTRHRQYQNPVIRKGPIIASISGPTKPNHQARPANFYKENSVEDYSDLIEANDGVLERKLSVTPVSKTLTVVLSEYKSINYHLGCRAG